MNSSLLKTNRSHWFYITLLFIVAIISYWQIATLKYSVTHDMINCWIPWRYYISSCFENHTFPFWNPYQQLGYPIHADLQGPTWYPESIILSMTIGQDNVTVQLLFIFYVFLAGTGMYFLSLAFQKNRTIAFLIGMSYMLSGFFVAHVQHFYAIIGAAWLPFIILNYYKMYIEKSYLRALYASVFMFLNLTGGNHTFSIILFYLCLIFFGYFAYEAIKEKQKENIKKYILLNSVFGISTVLMASVVIVAYLQTAPYVERLSGLVYEKAAVCPLSPQSLLSVLVPFSTVNSNEFFNTDPSMSNIYFGILLLPFTLLLLFSRKNTFDKILLVFALVCLLASFGSYTPIHRFIFNYVPLMNLFRFPSYFSLFTVLIILLLSGQKIEEIIENSVPYQKKLNRLILVIIAVVIALLIFAFFKNKGQTFFFFNSFQSIFDLLAAAALYQNIILQGSIQLLFLVVFFFVLKIKDPSKRLVIFSIVLCFNLIMCVQFSIAQVGMSPASPKELNEYLATLPKDFPIPDTTKIINNTEEIGQKHGLYRNTSIFHKRIGADVFNSYCFSNYAMLKDSLPDLYKNMLNNQLFYFSDKVVLENEVWKMRSNEFNNQTIVLEKNNFQIAEKFIEKTNDSIGKSSYKIGAFSPNKIELTIDNKKNQLLTLLQSNYNGWEVLIDENKSEILESNFLTMSVMAPKGVHRLIFSYKNPKIVIAAIVSYSSLLIVLAIISFYRIRKKDLITPISIWAPLILIFIYYFI